jgi:N utilization substance protein A
VAVYSRERDVDPVGACVGMKGSRVQSIIRELRGEKIDIIEWSDDLVTFAQSALAPAKITRVSVTHQGEVPHLDVIVEDEQLSLAIGKRGQNVRLASELIGARIDIKSESDVKDEVADALARMLQTAMGGSAAASAVETLDLAEAPGMDAESASQLEAAGYGTLEAIAEAGPDALAEVASVGTLDRAQAIHDWAKERLEEGEKKRAEEIGAGLSLPRAESSSSMGDADFMAALSRAFQESEAQRASVAKDDENPDNTTAEPGSGEEP